MSAVIVLGFGSVGQNFAEILAQAKGGKSLRPNVSIVGVSDSQGAIFCGSGNGISLDALLQNTSLVKVNLDGCKLGDEEIGLLVDVCKRGALANVTYLDLSYNQMADAGATAGEPGLRDVPRRPCVRRRAEHGAV